MRTTLAIDDDILLAAREIADHRRQSIGAVISNLARQTLNRREPVERNSLGLPLLPRQGRTGLVTLDMVNRLRDEMP